jgi:hypothetical protein
MAPFRPQYKRPLAATNMRPLLGQHQYKKSYTSVGTQPLRGCHLLNGPFLANTRPFVVGIRPLAATIHSTSSRPFINTKATVLGRLMAPLRPSYKRPLRDRYAAPMWPALYGLASVKQLRKSPTRLVGTRPLRGCHQANGPFAATIHAAPL